MNGMPLWLSMVISVITLRGRSFQRCKFWWLYVIPEIIQPHGWLQNDESIDQSLPWLRLCGNENERPCLLSVRSGLVVRGLRSAKEKRPLQRPGMVHRGWGGYRLSVAPGGLWWLAFQPGVSQATPGRRKFIESLDFVFTKLLWPVLTRC